MLANSTACLIVMSIFFHLFVRSSVSDVSSSSADANLDSLAASESASLFIAEEFGVVGVVCVGVCCFRCRLCKFLLQVVVKLSVAGRRAVCKLSMVVWLQNAQSVVNIGK